MTVDYEQAFERLMAKDVYSLAKSEKHEYFMPVMQALHSHHYQHSAAYRKLSVNALTPLQQPEDIPFVAVRLFKQFALKSIKDDQVFRVLQSSGTTGQVPSKVFLDKQTSARQSKVLVKIMQSFIGKQRLPMLVIDCPSVLKSKALSARAAGIQGMAFFGREMTFALNDDMTLNSLEVKRFCERFGTEKVLVFGFTFMVWQYFIEILAHQRTQVSLPNAILIHSGGWKKLKDRAVDNTTFKEKVLKHTHISKVHNFYGMAEQVGSVFVECEQGHLHVPSLAEIIIRNPFTLKPETGSEVGLIQVISAVPTSYPGFSITTEDLGRIVGEDNCRCGRMGKYFEVIGRLPRAEVRGCSDTQVAAV